MANHTHPPTSRPPVKPILPDQEEALANLRLGEFQNIASLGLPEARLVIESIINSRQQAGKKFQETEVLHKMQTYLDTFARFRRLETIKEVIDVFEQPKLFEPFEVSQLVTLCCETHDEAKTLIPSIANKISDDDLQNLLDEVTKRRNFTE